jgi:hypothetical protein
VTREELLTDILHRAVAALLEAKEQDESAQPDVDLLLQTAEQETLAALLGDDQDTLLEGDGEEEPAPRTTSLAIDPDPWERY